MIKKTGEDQRGKLTNPPNSQQKHTTKNFARFHNYLTMGHPITLLKVYFILGFFQFGQLEKSSFNLKKILYLAKMT